MPQTECMARTINSAKPRIFLADLEYAKKEEWERRRKLRLKQVRQQARDIATVIRTQAINARKRNEIATKCKQLNAEFLSDENKQSELECKLTDCLTAVGTGHSSASMMTEVDELVKDKTELQDALARVRAELAAEKARENRKSRSEVAENPREGTSISKIASSKPSVKPAIKKYFPALNSSHDTVPVTPPKLVSSKRQADCGGSSESISSQPVAEKTILSPPMVSHAKSRKQKVEKIDDSSYPDGRQSCPPVTEVIEADDLSSDSDSGQTWPPSSVKKKSSKVRMYDHSARKCSEYVQQCGIVRMETPDGMNMQELIKEEEDLLSKKTDDDLENRRVELQRGVRALREEIAKQDWDSAISKLCQFAKEKRIKKGLAYPNTGADQEEPLTSAKNSEKEAKAAPQVEQRELKTDHPEDEGVRNAAVPRASEQEGDSSKHQPSVKSPATSLMSIFAKFNRQREAVLNEESVNIESSDEEECELPSWLRAEVEAQDARRESGGHPDRVGTPETMMESLNERRRQRGSSSSLSSSSSNHSDPPSNTSVQDTTKKPGSPQPPDSNREASNSTSSGDINVEIRFSKGNSPSNRMPSKESSTTPPEARTNKKQSIDSPNKDSSSTSYYSPPEKLSPQQLSLLSGILSRMSVKNRNPVLHHYINRVLEMSRHSVSDLNVSSSSELSVQSDLFKQTRSTPLRPTVPHARNLRFKDNSSTAVSISSAPRDSVGDISSSDNATEIAALLRNILELQRVYRSATSSDQLSDSVSSYRSVPDIIGADHCDNVSPIIGPVTNFGEDTGIFESHHADGQRPMLYTIFDKDALGIGIPYELFPKPIFGVSDSHPSDKFDRKFDDAPDGYAMRPEHHPISLKLPKREPRKIPTSLSDIESEVSSIQSSPTKILGRRSTTPVSIAATDKDSTVSGLSSGEFISSAQLQNNDLIASTPDSTSDFEDVFQSLGLGWALTTLRRIRNARNLPADDSTSKTTSGLSSGLTSSSDYKMAPSYRHSTPIKPKGCPKPAMESSENDAVPSLTPPNLTLLCPTLQKSSSC